MPRPQRCRRICAEPEYGSFAPEGGILQSEAVELSLDEFETVRLIDLLRMTHEQCASEMLISRTTVTEIYERARQKLADSVVNGKRLVIRGGNVLFCEGGRDCGRHCAHKTTTTIRPKGEQIMRIAVTYENGNIFQHFGHTEFFKLYDIEGGKVVTSEVVSTNGSGHGALAGFLQANGADILI